MTRNDKFFWRQNEKGQGEIYYLDNGKEKILLDGWDIEVIKICNRLNELWRTR